MRSAVALLCLLSFCVIPSAGAQPAGTRPAGRQVGSGTAAQTSAATGGTTNGTAERTLSGVVTDADGAVVPGAKVGLKTGLGKPRSTVTDADGHFSFQDVEAGPYMLTVSAEGMEQTTEHGTLNADESLELPAVALRAAATEEVEVSGQTQQELAERQMKQEEGQRLLGLVPNFYVSYTWNAAPLDAKQKYHLALRTLVDPATFVIVAGFAGIEQADDEFSGYGQGWQGYGKRYGAGLANASIGDMLGGAVLPALFHQDPRFFYKSTGTKWQRTQYAIAMAVIARGDNGKWQPAYANILGQFASGAISNLYYPAANRGVELTFEAGLLDLVGNAADNLLEEFVLKRISTGVRGHAAAQP